MAEPELYTVIDSRFANLTIGNAQLERVYTGCRWAEGPVWFKDGNYLVWSDIPNHRMLRYIPEVGTHVFRADSHYSNGNTRDREGRLLTCHHGTRSLTRTEHDGTITTLADQFEGKRLNSPNDVVAHSNGSIWFTDPTYGILSDYEGFKAEPEQRHNNLFRLDPSGELQAAASDFVQPNGLAFSPDEALLYVADSGISHDENVPRRITVFDVIDGRLLANPRKFCDLKFGTPDGLRTDTSGNVWTSGGNAVHVYAPDGTLLGRINIPETVSNLTFGGPRGNQLFITATTSIYSIFVNATGTQQP